MSNSNTSEIMKLNKNQTTANILSLIAGQIRPCTKRTTDNIIFPKWSDIGLWGEIFAMKVKTKEQPQGCDYDEAKFQVVMRVIDGKVLMTGGRPDAYTWKAAKVAEYVEKKEFRYIGINSAQGIITLSKVINTIPEEKEQEMFADFFSAINKDLLLITSGEESRQYIEVTPELYNAGITACVDSWMEPDENGEADATILNIGDFLIIEGDRVYCIRHDEFVATHIFD